MANWSIYRITQPTDGIATLNCIIPAQPTRVVLYDSDNNVYESVDVCFDPTTGHACALVDILAGAGYTPNDWTAECP